VIWSEHDTNVATFPGDDHHAEMRRLLDAGASEVGIGQGAVPWMVLADPEGNELCLLTPR